MLNLLFGGTTYLGISKRGIAYCQADGVLRRPSSWRSAETRLSPEVSSTELPAQITGSLRDLLASQHAVAKKTKVTLADTLVRYFVVTPPGNTGSIQDCRDAATARFSVLYDDPITEWEIEGHWHPSHPFLVCALPKALLNQTLSTAAEFKLLVTEIAPYFVAIWNALRHRLSPHQWLVVRHEDNLSIACLSDQGVQHFRTVSIPSEATHQTNWLHDSLTHCAMYFDTATPSHVHLVGVHNEAWQTALSMPFTLHQNKQSRHTSESMSPLINLALGGQRL